MDNNLPEVEIHEKKNYTAVLIIILLFILVLGGWYALNKQKGSDDVFVEENNSEAQPSNGDPFDYNLPNNPSLTIVEGVLVSVSNNEISVSLPSTDKKEGVIKITPETVIQKLIISKETGESRGIEINLSDLQAGDNISITYNNTENGNPFDNALVISAVIEASDFEEVYQKQASLLVSDGSEFVYVKGKVTSVDKNMIEYVPYVFNKLGTDKHFTLIQQSTKFYTIQNAGRINIEHAKIESDATTVKVDDEILVVVDKNANPLQENTIATEIIVVNK